MAETIPQPRPTRYKGYHMRSRLEARWAVFFDSLNETWEYESEGYRFDGISYLPDFWLPGMKLFVEIKPTWEKSDEVILTLRKFRENIGPILCCVGQPGGLCRLCCHDVTASSGGHFDDDSASLATVNGRLVVVTTNNCGEQTFCNDRWELLPRIVQAGSNYETPYDAICAARSARFEHGQSGAT